MLAINRLQNALNLAPMVGVGVVGRNELCTEEKCAKVEENDGGNSVWLRVVRQNLEVWKKIDNFGEFTKAH